MIGAVGNNTSDVAGVSWQVDLLDIATNSTRAGAFCDGTPLSAVIAGIDYAVSDPTRTADVINISLGAHLERCPTGLQTAIDDARANGAVVVASAGNGQTDPDTADATAYPAGCDGVISVGATDRNDRRASYSQTNSTVDLVAPGGDYDVGGIDGLIVTTHHAFTVNRLTYVEGTSFAAPYVAGVVALMRTIQPASGPGEVARVLADTAHDLGPDGRDDAYGHGLVQTDAAVAAAVSALPEAPSPDDPTSPSPSPSPSPTGTAQPPPSDASVQRIDAGSPSRPIPTAVAVSRQVFPDDAADHIVLTRSDVFADALAGSTLAYGSGPLLFTASSGDLANATRREIQRVAPNGTTVYLLGGTQALPPGLEDELRDLGYRPQRVAGSTREQTAVAVAEEARRRIPQLGGTNPPQIVLATRSNWPDAVTAGSLGSTFGIPILLTRPDRLDDATRAFLDRTSPKTLYVAGGTVAIDQTTSRTAADAADATTVRLAGATRIGTALEIARQYDRLYQAKTGATPKFAAAINIYRDDAWSYILAGSAITGQATGVFIPTEGTDGHALPPDATDYLRNRHRQDDHVLGAAIGTALATLRNSRDLTTHQLADTVDLPVAELQQIEAGDHEPPISTLQQIASAMNTDVATVFTLASANGLTQPAPRTDPATPTNDQPPPTTPQPASRRQSHFRQARANAEIVLRDPGLTLQLATHARDLATETGATRLGDVHDDLHALTRLLEAYATGRFRTITWENLVLTTAALQYFVSPHDIVPDHLDAGYIDDAAILAFVCEMTAPDLDAFLDWEHHQ